MVDNSNTSVSYSAYQPSGQLGSKLEHVIITFQKNEIPLFGRAVEVVGWQSIFIVILCTLKQTTPVDTSAEHVKQLEDELLKLRIENAYLKELRRLRLEEETLLKKQRESSTASGESSN